MRYTRRTVISLLSMTLAGCLSNVGDRLTGKYEKKKQILEHYQNGIDSYNQGVNTLDKAIEKENWDKTIELATRSSSNFETGRDRFQKGVEISKEIGEDAAREYCRRGVDKCELMKKMASKVRASAQAYKRRNRTKGAKQWEEYQALQQKAQKNPIRPPSELAQVLDLPVE